MLSAIAKGDKTGKKKDGKISIIPMEEYNQVITGVQVSVSINVSNNEFVSSVYFNAELQIANLTVIKSGLNFVKAPNNKNKRRKNGTKFPSGYQDVLKLAKDNKCQFIDLKFIDLPGTWQHYTLPIKELADLFEEWQWL